jgi:hypothetical protein
VTLGTFQGVGQGGVEWSEMVFLGGFWVYLVFTFHILQHSLFCSCVTHVADVHRPGYQSSSTASKCLILLAFFTLSPRSVVEISEAAFAPAGSVRGIQNSSVGVAQ